MSPEQAAGLVAALAMSYPNSKFSTANAIAYESFLVDLDFAVASAAVAKVTASSKFLPAISELRAAALSSERGYVRAPEEGWGDVVDAIRSFGAYREPKFADPVVAYAVRCLGWRNVCLEDSSDASLRARFCEIYLAARDRERNELVSRPALGVGEGVPDAVRGLLAGIGGKQ